MRVVVLVTVGFCMWLRFAVWNAIVMRRMPEPVRIEFQHLLADPRHDQHRLLQIIDQYYGLDYVYPEIGNADWWTLGALLLTAMPVILLLGWWMSRPASRRDASGEAAS
jgi:two-component system sensor histidine kinase AdeS